MNCKHVHGIKDCKDHLRSFKNQIKVMSVFSHFKLPFYHAITFQFLDIPSVREKGTDRHILKSGLVNVQRVIIECYAMKGFVLIAICHMSHINMQFTVVTNDLIFMWFLPMI